MSVAGILEVADEPGALATADLADELVDLNTRLTALTARWILLLAEFDRREGWRCDGHLSCLDWLMWRCGMSRRTAQDRVRVAHELGRRPRIRELFLAGEVSYSKVRAITRITRVDEETDARILEVARLGTTADLERLARHFEHLEQQERGVEDYLRRYDRRTIRASRTYDGMMVIEKVLPIEEGEEYLAHLEAVDERSAEGMSALTNRPAA
jgi:hypothetical protein